MVPGDQSERQKVQWAVWSLRSVALSPSLKNTKYQNSEDTIHIDLTNGNSHAYTLGCTY